MTITLDVEDFLMAMLDGSWFSCKAIPDDLASKLLAQSTGSFVLNKPHPTAMYYDLWTIEGWANEMERLTYIARLQPAAPALKVKTPSKMELVNQLLEATQKGDIESLARIQKQLEGMK